jgi:hypothetical protein
MRTVEKLIRLPLNPSARELPKLLGFWIILYSQLVYECEGLFHKKLSRQLSSSD